MVIRIRTFLIFGFGGLLISALAITIFLGFNSAARNTYSLLTNLSDLLILTTTQNLENELKPVEKQAEWIAKAFENKEISLDNMARLESFLVASIGATRDVDGIVIITPDGDAYRVRQKTRKLEKLILKNINNVLNIVAQAKTYDGPKWGQPIWLEEISQAAINLRTPLFVDGKFIAMLGQINSVSNLSKTLSRNSSYMKEHTPFILYDGKFILAHPWLEDNKFIGNDDNPLLSITSFSDDILVGFYNSDNFKNILTHNVNDNINEIIKINGKKFIFLYKNIAGYTDKLITLGVYFPLKKVNGEMRLLYGSMFIAFIVMVISILLAIWLSRKISKPVDQLQLALKAVKHENYDNIPKINHSILVEFNNSTAAFNNMIKGLKEKEVIRGLFGKVVPSAVAEMMLKNPDGLKPQKTIATVLFADLEKFTNISEQLEPEGIVQVLNHFFSKMTDIIRANGGIVTQFQGDAVLAVFNVPIEDVNHASNAIIAAYQMTQAMNDMTVLGHKLCCRIGVSTGLLVAGNVGAEMRMNYTVHGDAVNLAARLEQLNKQYGTVVLISKSTVDAAKNINMDNGNNQLKLKSLGKVEIRGKSDDVDIFTLDI